MGANPRNCCIGTDWTYHLFAETPRPFVSSFFVCFPRIYVCQWIAISKACVFSNVILALKLRFFVTAELQNFMDVVKFACNLKGIHAKDPVCTVRTLWWCTNKHVLRRWRTWRRRKTMYWRTPNNFATARRFKKTVRKKKTLMGLAALQHHILQRHQSVGNVQAAPPPERYKFAIPWIFVFFCPWCSSASMAFRVLPTL